MLQREQSNNRRYTYNSSNLIFLIADTHQCDHYLSDGSAIQNGRNSSQKIHKSLDETERLQPLFINSCQLSFFFVIIGSLQPFPRYFKTLEAMLETGTITHVTILLGVVI